jgi:hypothetical protein
LNLPGAAYHAEWIDTRSGLVVKSEDFTHANGRRVMVSPVYSEDIALRLSPPVQRTLTVTSSPASGVLIGISLADFNGAANGVTDFTRSYLTGSTLMLTAPASATGGSFLKWRKNGADFSSNASTSILIDGDHTFTAVYSNSPAAAELLVNGSFESGFAAWSATGNLLIQSVTPYVATDGTNLVGFNGANTAPNGVLSQSFATTPGVTYTLTFDLGVLSYNTAQQQMKVNVAGTGTLVSQTIVITGVGGGNSNWLPQSIAFVANSTSTTLTFTDTSLSTAGLDHLLDNVSVKGVPPSVVATPLLSAATLTGAPGTGICNVGMSVTTPGVYVLQRSEDLQNWVAVAEIVVTEAGNILFEDAESPKARMFYRIALRPD